VQSGYVLLPLDPKLGERELEHIARDADPQVALAADPKVVSGRLGAVVTLEVSVPPRTVDEGSFRPLTAADPALLLYTSGTTGLPKGVLLSSQAIAEDLDALASAWAWTEADTVVHALPVFHVHGLVLGLFGAIRRGGALSWVPRFAVADLLQALALESGREGARAVLFAVPTMYHRIADVAEPETEEGRWARQALGGARLLVSGSAALPSREHDRIARLAGQRIVERYGMTETLITCAMRADGDRRAGVVGPPVDGVEIRLKERGRRHRDRRARGPGPHVAARVPEPARGHGGGAVRGRMVSRPGIWRPSRPTGRCGSWGARPPISSSAEAIGWARARSRARSSSTRW
jgi:malonyl-CoA/methylmalonyl-CoA synthetase